MSKDYFDLFGLPESFIIDMNELMVRYRELQQRVHPDKFVGASDQERLLSIQTASEVNEAYRTLKDPLMRAGYLLRLRGVDVDNSVEAMDHEFLEEQMLLRDNIEEMRYSGDPDKLLVLANKGIASRIQDIETRIGRHLEDGDPASLNEVRKLYHKMQYFYRLNEELQALEEELEQ